MSEAEAVTNLRWDPARDLVHAQLKLLQQAQVQWRRKEGEGRRRSVGNKRFNGRRWERRPLV